MNHLSTVKKEMKKARTEILGINQIFTEYLINCQQAKYDQSVSPYHEGDATTLHNTDKAVTLTKEQAEALNKEDKEFFIANKDTNPFETELKANHLGSSILRSGKNSTKAYLTDLSESLEGLRLLLDQEALIILADWPTPWLYQENDYPPAKRAYEFFQGKIETSFNGGFELKSSELTGFIPHLFWLIRCNASLPEFRMTFPTSGMVISICQYGNLHLEFYDEKEQKKALKYFNSIGFFEVENCRNTKTF